MATQDVIAAIGTEATVNDDGTEVHQRLRQLAHAQADEGYFASYGSLQVHKLMLQDAPRTEAYLKALQANADFITGKVFYSGLRIRTV